MLQLNEVAHIPRAGSWRNCVVFCWMGCEGIAEGAKCARDKDEEQWWLERAPCEIGLSWTVFLEISLRLHIPWSLLGCYFEGNLLEQTTIEPEREPTAKQWRHRADWHSSFFLELFYLGRWPYTLEWVRHGINTVFFVKNSSVKVCIWTLVLGWGEGWSLFTCQQFLFCEWGWWSWSQCRDPHYQPL